MDDALRIALQSGLPYTGLRDFEIDPRLLRYVPLRVATEEQIVPVVLIANTLTIAAPRPQPDLTTVRKHFPHLGIDVVIAPATEIAAALRRAEGAPPR